MVKAEEAVQMNWYCEAAMRRPAAMYSSPGAGEVAMSLRLFSPALDCRAHWKLVDALSAPVVAFNISAFSSMTQDRYCQMICFWHGLRLHR